MMTKSASDVPLGIIRSTAVISLGLVALAGSIASVLINRIMTPPNKTQPATAQISKLVTDEWEADLARLNLPSRSEVEALNRQIAELEAQIDQLTQARANSQEEHQENLP
jgi:ubiquinone biosynthesis protein UbiJ